MTLKLNCKCDIRQTRIVYESNMKMTDWWRLFSGWDKRNENHDLPHLQWTWLNKRLPTELGVTLAYMRADADLKMGFAPEFEEAFTDITWAILVA